MRSIYFSFGFLLAYGMAVPTGSKSAPTCNSIAYAQFEGSICGILVFKGFTDQTVTVETVGDGICGLHAFTGPFPYHGSPLCELS